jgi:antitoxin component of MazEF toxin-antitoxin module
MAISTIRPKNQITLPSELMAQAGLSQGMPVEFQVTRQGLAIRPFGTGTRNETLLDVARRLSAAAPGAADIEFEVTRVGGAPRQAQL